MEVYKHNYFRIEYYLLSFPSSRDFSFLKSFRFARRIAIVMKGDNKIEKPLGSPLFLKVIFVDTSSIETHS